MQTLEEQVARMLEGMKRLSEDNLALRAEIDAERQARHRLESRLDEARTRVESALGRLPAGPADMSLGVQRSAPPGTPLSTPSSTPLSKAD
jgi:chromosome segregation ATPase